MYILRKTQNSSSFIFCTLLNVIFTTIDDINLNTISNVILGVQLYFRRFPIDGFSGKWWSK